jgi:hypothetical protein
VEASARSETEPGAQPEMRVARYDEAEPRLTSSGKAVTQETIHWLQKQVTIQAAVHQLKVDGK